MHRRYGEAPALGIARSRSGCLRAAKHKAMEGEWPVIRRRDFFREREKSNPWGRQWRKAHCAHSALMEEAPATQGGGDKARAPNAEPTAKSEASNALAAMKAIHDGPHRGPVRQANHSADETTQRYPANPRVLRGYGYHLSGPSLLVSTHPSPPADHGVSTNACFALSIDHTQSL